MATQIPSGASTSLLIRSLFLQSSFSVTITRPSPKPATTYSARIQAQQMGARQADKLRFEGGLNFDAPLPVNFLFLPEAGVLVGDVIPYQGASWKVISVMPQTSPDNVVQFVEAKATVLS